MADQKGDPTMRWVRFSKDDAVSYGSLDGDTIKGSIVLPGRDGGDPQTVDWTATRSKAGASTP